jgi:hypothetical protein
MMKAKVHIHALLAFGLAVSITVPAVFAGEHQVVHDAQILKPAEPSTSAPRAVVPKRAKLAELHRKTTEPPFVESAVPPELQALRHSRTAIADYEPQLKAPLAHAVHWRWDPWDFSFVSLAYADQVPGDTPGIDPSELEPDDGYGKAVAGALKAVLEGLSRVPYVGPAAVWLLGALAWIATFSGVLAGVMTSLSLLVLAVGRLLEGVFHLAGASQKAARIKAVVDKILYYAKFASIFNVQKDVKKA